MCKAIEYSAKLLDTYEEIEKDFNRLTQKLSKYDKMQEVILHKIENDKFSACDGYKLAKEIKDIREQRRLVKNEITPLSLLKKSIEEQKNNLIKVNKSIESSARKLSNAMENKSYDPKLKEVI